MKRQVTRVALLAWIICLLFPHSATLADGAKFEPFVFESADGQKVDAEIGHISVPENRQDPNSRSIRLAFVRFPATGRKGGSPIVYLAGGPGGSGIGTARGTRFPLFMALREYGDVIAFDQRGTGRSEAELDCSERFAIPFDQPLDRHLSGKIVAEAAGKCAARLRESGIDLDGYNTEESADDLDDLRKALGADKLTLWGISYGTHLALATAKRHPDRIDRMILAGLEGLDHSWKLPSDQQSLLEAIAALAAKDSVTRETTPDLLGSIEALLEKLEREPVGVPLTHPELGMTVTVMVGKLDLQMALAGALRGPDSFAGVPDIVSRMSRGDFVPLALAAGQRRMGQVPDGMSMAMDCASGGSAAWLAQIEREKAGTLLEDAINLPYPAICAGVGVPDLGDRFRAPLRSDIPTLLISGTLDGRTPPSNGEKVLAGLSKGRHLVVENAGHSDPLFLSTPAILEEIERFLAGKKQRRKTVAAPAAKFLSPRTVVELDASKLDRYVGSYRIEGGGERKVFRAGSLLYSQRDGGRMFPIRPSSESEFFFEGYDIVLRFESDGDGNVTRMIAHQPSDSPGIPAER